VGLALTNKQPESSYVWRKIRYNHYHNANDHQLYFPGSIAFYGGKFYISRHINFLFKTDWLNKEILWFEFTHPGQVHNLPETPPANIDDTLAGADSNNNLIRDDFEYKVLFSNYQPEVTNAAMAAGKVYQLLVTTSEESQPPPTQKARDLVAGFVLAEMCKRTMHRRYSGNAWSEASHFNTIDRIKVKYSYINYLTSMVGYESIDIPTGDACVNLESYRLRRSIL
ncbi:hypothetical protein KO507_10515, partial [Gilvimarinus agarilyticus]|uniref:hypothetical protein n=1 Tax=Gilvimarinus sp. 2_MG-2023 TaxID=3062666 RepID=UPI001C099B28